MRRVVSVSLGSSRRNKKVEAEFLGEKFIIERIGTDGDLKKAYSIIKSLDGDVDAFGLGGMDLYISIGKKRFIIREAYKLIQAAQKTPIVDGSGLKNTLERKTVRYLEEKGIIDFAGKDVLLVCALDRFGMAECLDELGARVCYGDLMFALGLPFPVYSLRTLEKVANIFAPVACKLPFKYLYPTGKKQDKQDKKRFQKYYEKADIIAGDFHYIKKYMPEVMRDKVIITNTVTSEDLDTLKNAGVEKLITTTPNFGGRSFGTNVIEAVIITVAGKQPGEMTVREYEEIIDKLGFEPRVEYFQRYKGAIVNG